MTRHIVRGVALALFSLPFASAVYAQAQPTIHADDIVKALSAPSAAATQPVMSDQGACDRNAWVTDDDGQPVHPKCNSLGFNLGAASNSAAGSPARHVAGGSHRPMRTAYAPAAPVAGQTFDLLLTFDTGSAELTPQDVANAQQFVIAANDPSLAGARFRVEGYTDKAGAYAYNVDLSQRRADATKAYLISLGVNADRIAAKGLGPVLVRPDAPLDQANRRVIARRIQ